MTPRSPERASWPTTRRARPAPTARRCWPTPRRGGGGSTSSPAPRWWPNSSGNSNGGTINGTVTRELSGALFEHTGSCFSFPQTTGPGAGYVTIPASGTLGGATFTVEAWVYLESYGNTAQFRCILVKEGAGAGTYRNYGVWLSAGSGATVHYAYQNTSGVFNSFNTRFQLKLKRWHHLALAYTAGSGQLRFYVDGEVLEQQLTVGDPGTTTSPLHIGGSPAFDSFPGRIDEVAFYGTDLGASRIRAHAQAGARGRYPLSENILDDLPQQPEWANKTVGLPALGLLSRLHNTRVSTALYQNLRTDQAFDILCDAAGIPKDARVVNPGSSTLLWWWLDQEAPWEAAVKLLHTEGPGAAIYEDADGRLNFEGRQYRLARPRCTTVQATYADGFDEPHRLDALDYNPGLKHIVNACTIEVVRREASSLQTVWSLGSDITIPANGTVIFTATSSDSSPLTGAVAPTQGPDFGVPSGSITAVSLFRTSGAKIPFSLTAGAAGASVNNLQLRAQRLPISGRAIVTNNVDASASIAKYGRQSFPYDVWPELDYLQAQDFCDAVVQAYQDPRPYVRVQTVPSIGGTTGHQTLNRQISDRVAILDQQLVTVMEAFVEQIEYRYEGGRFVTVLGCEKAFGGVYAVWGTAQWDTARWGY